MVHLSHPYVTTGKIIALTILIFVDKVISLLSHMPSRIVTAFLMVQLSHPYMTTGKIIALTIQTVVSKVISLLFDALSRFVMAFLSRS